MVVLLCASAGVRRVKFTAETGFDILPIGSGTTVNAGDGDELQMGLTAGWDKRSRSRWPFDDAG